MDNQCNTCGGFEKLDVCLHCKTVVCRLCQLYHSSLCEELQKRKRRGEGPTIANQVIPEHRAGHVAPIAGPADRPARGLMPTVLAGPTPEDAIIIAANLRQAALETIPAPPLNGRPYLRIIDKPPLDAVLRQEYVPEADVETPLAGEAHDDMPNNPGADSE